KRAWLVVLAVGCGSGSATTGHIEFMQSQLLKSCAMYVSCVTDQLPISGAACADVLEHTVAGDPYDISAFGNGPHAEDQARRVAECAQAATDCGSVMACATQNHDPTYCAAHRGMSCDGELAIHCTNGAAGSFAGSGFGWADPGPDDCTKRGTHCHNGFCSDGLTCSTVIDKICVDATHESLCDEGNGIASTIDCSVSAPGSRCLNDGCGPAYKCSFEGCDGNTLVVCGTLASARIDCGALGGHCGIDTRRGQIQDCIPDATECDSTSPDRCNGNAIEICINGKYQSFDCTSIGLSTCSTIIGRARCTR
ncbi:MAG: hypothetical protein JWM53_5961, partial [bacterium]|nr:hypothetical protein [bacterium]